MTRHKITVGAIVAVDEEGGIGKNGKMAWHIPEDFKHFKEYTKNSLCIMGSTTFNDIVSHKKTNHGELLPGRTCLVLSRDVGVLRETCPFSRVSFISDGEFFRNALDLSIMSNNNPFRQYDKICVIGGKSIYDLFFDVIDEIVVTKVKGTYECDTYMDLTPYEKIANSVESWPLEGTPHLVERYILEHELGEL